MFLSFPTRSEISSPPTNMKRDPTQLHIASSHGHLDLTIPDMLSLRLSQLRVEKKSCLNYVTVIVTSSAESRLNMILHGAPWRLQLEYMS